MLAKGERGRGRFVDNIYHIEPGHLPCIRRRLPAWFIEVRRYRNHNSVLFSDCRVDVALYLLEDISLNDFRRELLAMNRAGIRLISHIALDAFDNRIRLRTACRSRPLANHDRVTIEQHHTWRKNLPVAIANHRGLAGFRYVRRRR